MDGLRDTLDGIRAEEADITTPSSSTDNAVVRFDGTDGKTIQGSGVTIDDSDNMIIPSNLTVAGDLTVNGTTTTVNTDTLDVKDPNILLNDGGNDATSEGAGITVERTGTNGSIVYEDALASKFKVGAEGAEVEIVDVSTAQTLTNKSIVATQIDSGTLPDARIQASGVTQHQNSITSVGTLDDLSVTGAADFNGGIEVDHATTSEIDFKLSDASKFKINTTSTFFNVNDVTNATDSIQIDSSTNEMYLNTPVFSTVPHTFQSTTTFEGDITLDGANLTGANDIQADNNITWNGGSSTNANTAYTHSQLTSGNPHNVSADDIFPSGSIMQYAGTSAPSGWLFCDGSEVSRTTYATLFTITGSGATFGAGNGETTFNLPDLRGRTAIGVGTGAGLTARSLGDSSGQEAITDVVDHDHTMAVSADSDSDTPTGRYVSTNDSGSNYGNAKSGSDTLAADAINNTGSASVNVMNPFLALNYIIKT